MIYNCLCRVVTIRKKHFRRTLGNCNRILSHFLASFLPGPCPLLSLSWAGLIAKFRLQIKLVAVWRHLSRATSPQRASSSLTKLPPSFPCQIPSFLKILWPSCLHQGDMLVIRQKSYRQLIRNWQIGKLANLKCTTNAPYFVCPCPMSSVQLHATFPKPWLILFSPTRCVNSFLNLYNS